MMTTDIVTDAVSAFPSISLTDLVSEAELLTRVDRKYVVPTETLTQVLASLDPRTRVLEVDGSRGSQYSTMYFDTPDLLSYRLAALGRRRRFKLRTRHYVDTGAVFLELKTRGARGTTVKERIEVPLEATDHLTPEGRAYAAEGLAGLGLTPSVVDDLSPVLRTEYRRTTLLLPDGARSTIDTELQWIDADGHDLTYPGLTIVETKSASRASLMDRVLWAHRVRPSSISKFATGLAALRPHLPHTKWNRVLQRSLRTIR